MRGRMVFGRFSFRDLCRGLRRLETLGGCFISGFYVFRFIIFIIFFLGRVV